MKDNYRKSSIWYKERITDPRQIISDFFIYSELEFYRKTIRQVIRVASSKRIWTKSEPGGPPEFYSPVPDSKGIWKSIPGIQALF